MPRSVLLALFFTVLYPVVAFGETDSLPPRYFSLGSKKAGIGFGNAPVYTGFKFNLINKNVKRVNIFDFCVYGESDTGTINGISLGVVVNAVPRVNGIAIASFVTGVKRENGLMTGFLVGVEKLNGIGIGGMIACDTLNGVAISFFSLVPQKFIERRDSMTHRVNGMAVSVFGSNVSEFRGVAIGGFNDSEQHKGLAVGVFNKTDRLKGVQIGLYNVAMNNPRGLRRLPLINMHFGR